MVDVGIHPCPSCRHSLLYSGENSWLWAFVGLGCGAYWFYRGFRLLARRRLILDTPASKIRSASIGLVELSGLAGGPYTLRAPLTGMPCYYYRTLAWQLKQSGKNSHWEKVADEALYVPFYLDDTTAKVLVDPQGAELDLHRDFQEEFHTAFFSTRPDVPSNAAGFLSASIDTGQSTSSRNIRSELQKRALRSGNADPESGHPRECNSGPRGFRRSHPLCVPPGRSGEFADRVRDSRPADPVRPNPLPSVAFRGAPAPLISPRPSGCPAANLPPMRST